jgi:hypothetical protein
MIGKEITWFGYKMEKCKVGLINNGLNTKNEESTGYSGKSFSLEDSY